MYFKTLNHQNKREKSGPQDVNTQKYSKRTFTGSYR